MYIYEKSSNNRKFGVPLLRVDRLLINVTKYWKVIHSEEDGSDSKQEAALTVNRDRYRAILTKFLFPLFEEEYLANNWFLHTTNSTIEFLLPILENRFYQSKGRCQWTTQKHALINIICGKPSRIMICWISLHTTAIDDTLYLLFRATQTICPRLLWSATCTRPFHKRDLLHDVPTHVNIHTHVVLYGSFTLLLAINRSLHPVSIHSHTHICQ